MSVEGCSSTAKSFALPYSILDSDCSRSFGFSWARSTRLSRTLAKSSKKWREFRTGQPVNVSEGFRALARMGDRNFLVWL